MNDRQSRMLYHPLRRDRWRLLRGCLYLTLRSEQPYTGGHVGRYERGRFSGVQMRMSPIVSIGTTDGPNQSNVELLSPTGPSTLRQAVGDETNERLTYASR
jgi:hypothetical protein